MRRLFVWEHLREEAVDARLGRDRRCRALVVAGDHHHLQTEALERHNALARSRTKRVSNGDDASRLAVHSHEHCRLALGGELRAQPIRRHELRAAHAYLAARDARDDPEAAPRFEPLGVGDDQAAGERCRNDRLGQRMLALTLGGRGESEQFSLVESVARDEVGHHGLAFGQRASLVQHHRSHFASPLQRLGALDQNAHLGATPGPDHDRRRGRETHGAGAGDDEHGDEDRDRIGERGLRAEDEPGQRGQRRDQEHGGNEVARHEIREPLDRGLRRLRLLDQSDDLRQERLLTDPHGAEAERAAGVERAADDLIARLLVHRHALPGHHRLVHRAGAGEDEPVDCDLLSRTNDHDVADAHIFDRDLDFLAELAPHARGLRTELHELLDRIRGVRPGACLQVSAEKYQRDDHRARLVVQIHARLEAGSREHAREERRHDGDAVRGGRADRDQRAHVRLAVPSGGDRADVEGPPGVELNGGRQREEKIGAPVRALEVREHKRRHREHHRKRAQHRGNHETSTRLRQRSAPRLDLPIFRSLATTRAVSPCLDRADELIELDAIRIDPHPRGLGRQIHARLLHARDLLQRRLDRANTAGAGHPLDREGQVAFLGLSGRTHVS